MMGGGLPASSKPWDVFFAPQMMLFLFNEDNKEITVYRREAWHDPEVARHSKCLLPNSWCCLPWKGRCMSASTVFFCCMIGMNQILDLMIVLCILFVSAMLGHLHILEDFNSCSCPVHFFVCPCFACFCCRRGWCKPLAPLCNEERWWFATSASLRRFCQWPAPYAPCSRRMLLDDPAIQYHYTVAMGHVDNTKTCVFTNPKATVERCNFPWTEDAFVLQIFRIMVPFSEKNHGPRWPSADAGLWWRKYGCFQK